MKPPQAEATQCPRCGFSGPSTSECSRCGIIYDKYRAGGRPASAPTRFTLLPWLVGLVAVVGVVAGFDALRSRTPAAGEPRPLPTGQPDAGEVPPVPEPARPVATAADSTSFPESVWAPVEDPERLPEQAAQPQRRATPSYTWYEGAGGFERGVEEAQREGKALALYFYTDWCPYCRELESELLTRAKVEDFLKYLVKIRVNPESGSRERLLANEYGVHSYPSFFIQTAPGASPRKIRRTDSNGLKSPEDFVATLQRAAG